MEVLGFLLLILALGGVVAATALRGKAWKDFTDRVADKKDWETTGRGHKTKEAQALEAGASFFRLKSYFSVTRAQYCAYFTIYLPPHKMAVKTENSALIKRRDLKPCGGLYHRRGG